MGASTRFVHRKATKPNVDRGLSFFDSGEFFDDGFGCGVGGQYVTPGNLFRHSDPPLVILGRVYPG